MRILILPSARDDLSDGFDFYEQQEKGLGDYFQESLFSDIESLASTRAFIPNGLDSIAFWPDASVHRSIMIKNSPQLGCGLSWTAGVIHA